MTLPPLADSDTEMRWNRGRHATDDGERERGEVERLSSTVFCQLASSAVCM
jgi:hypothetical protein